MRLNSHLIFGGIFASLGLLAGCASPPLPSPVPALLTDREALQQADDYLSHLGKSGWGYPATIESHKWGYLMSFESPYDPASQPTKVVHLLAVEHGGNVRVIQ